MEDVASSRNHESKVLQIGISVRMIASAVGKGHHLVMIEKSKVRILCPPLSSVVYSKPRLFNEDHVTSRESGSLFKAKFSFAFRARVSPQNSLPHDALIHHCPSSFFIFRNLCATFLVA
jgi:hypothetical protein